VDERKLMMKEAFRVLVSVAVFGTKGNYFNGIVGIFVELAAIFVGIIMVIVGISLLQASQKMTGASEYDV
jgi:small neutral amino acid transporter SnatA (MarC family)